MWTHKRGSAFGSADGVASTFFEQVRAGQVKYNNGLATRVATSGLRHDTFGDRRFAIRVRWLRHRLGRRPCHDLGELVEVTANRFKNRRGQK